MFDYFNRCLSDGIEQAKPVAVGYIARVVGLTLEARGINLALGARCLVDDGE